MNDTDPLTPEEWEAITEASFRGGAKAWRSEVERIVAARVAAAHAAAWDEGYERAEHMARCWGHTDHWGEEDPYPTNPYRAAVAVPEPDNQP